MEFVQESERQFHNMFDFQCPPKFQVLDSLFSNPSPQEEIFDLEKSIKCLQDMMQNHENFVFQSINRLESQQSQLVNSYRIEETLSLLANFDAFNSIDMTQESCHFENQASISSYQPKLDQNQILDILASYPFPEIKLKDECEPELQFSDSSPSLESISTL